MGGVIVKPAIHDAFMTGPDTAVELFHGYTYIGPSCRGGGAAHAALDALAEEDAFSDPGSWSPFSSRGCIR